MGTRLIQPFTGAVQNLLENRKSHDAEVSELKANLDIANRGFRSLREEMMDRQQAWERERLVLQSRIAAFEVIRSPID